MSGMDLLSLLFVVTLVVIVYMDKLADWTNMHRSNTNLLQVVTTIVIFPVFSILFFTHWFDALLYFAMLIFTIIAYIKSKSLEKQTLTAILDQVNNHKNYSIDYNKHLNHIDYAWKVEPKDLIEKFKKNGSIPNSVTLEGDEL